MRWTVPLAALAFTALPLCAQAPRTGEELISRMHDRYDGKWYQTLTFTQRTSCRIFHRQACLLVDDAKHFIEGLRRCLLKRPAGQ